jgi:hypothetical protein
MRLPRKILFALCWLVSVPAQTIVGNLYLLGQGDGTWCGFSTERMWTSEKDSGTHVLLVGKLDYFRGRVAVIYVTSLAETGDWTTYDKYSLDNTGSISSLERTIEVPEGFKQEQLWTIKNGHATEQKSLTLNLATNELVSEDKVSVSSPDVVTKLQEFPFWPLVRDHRQEIISKGKYCASGMMR